MAILAGCDFVLEFSSALLVKQLQSQSLPDGNAFQPPFDLNILSPSGSAHLMIDAMEVDINADNTLTITLSCSRSSVTSNNTPPVSTYPISGMITFKPKIDLVSVDPSDPNK